MSWGGALSRTHATAIALHMVQNPKKGTSHERRGLENIATMTAQSEITDALAMRSAASQRLSKALRILEGPERLQALKLCREAGIGASELASLAGISRTRLYQLLGS